MKYVSLDIETTGLKHAPENVLSIALVIEDDQQETMIRELPALKILFLHKPSNFEDTALAMNPKVFAARALARGHAKPDKLEGLVGKYVADGALKIIEEYVVVPDWDAASDLIGGFLGGEQLPMAGKNVASFDWKFLPQSVQSLFTGTFLDPGGMYKQPGDRYRPSMAECSRRAGISDFVSHDAYDDAIQVIELIRRAPKSTAENQIT